MDSHASVNREDKEFYRVAVESPLWQPVYSNGLDLITWATYQLFDWLEVLLNSKENDKLKPRWIGKHFTWGGGGGGGGGYMVGADILSSADWYHHSIIYEFNSNQWKLQWESCDKKWLWKLATSQIKDYYACSIITKVLISHMGKPCLL